MAETYILNQFDSIGKFIQAAEKNARPGESSHAKPDRHGDNWAGTKTFEEACQFARYGGWEPADMVEFRNLFDVEASLRKFTYHEWTPMPDVAGFEVNMQAYLDGEPEDMWEWMPEEQTVSKRALCIVIGHSVSAGCSARELFIRGQAAIALVRALSLLGYELEIWSEETVGGSYSRTNKLPDYFSTLVRLHAAGEAMDESAVEFAIGNPSWLRRLLFGFQEGQAENVRKKFGFGGGGYGSVTPIQHAETVGADVKLDLGRSWFRTYVDNEDTALQGMQWVLDQLKELGVVDPDAELETT